MRKMALKLIAALSLVFALSLASSPASAWEWDCEDNDPNPKNNYDPEGGGNQGGLFQVYQTNSPQGRRVTVICARYPQPKPYQPAPK